MKKIEIVDSYGDRIVLEPELGLYTTYDFMGNKMPGLGIELYGYDEDGFREPYATLTVSFGEFISAKNCAYVDANNIRFTDQLLEMGFCQNTGFTKESGFCKYPLWQFDVDFLREIDVHGVYDTYAQKVDKYFREGAQPPLAYRQGDVLEEVAKALGLEDVKVWVDVEAGEVTNVEDGNREWTGADFCRYLLDSVCEYGEDGSVKGLSLDLCHDFYDVCEMNGENFRDYVQARQKLKDKEMMIVTDVMDALGVDFEMDADSDGMVVWTNDEVYYGAEIYPYLLGSVCEFEADGSVKGLAPDLCKDFFGLCKVNGVDYQGYGRPSKELDERIGEAEEQSQVSEKDSGGRQEPSRDER